MGEPVNTDLLKFPGKLLKSIIKRTDKINMKSSVFFISRSILATISQYCRMCAIQSGYLEQLVKRFDQIAT